MWQDWTGSAKICAVAVGLWLFLYCQAALAQAACEQIKSACKNAGFVQGGLSSGTGLWRDCIEPIIQGTPQRRKASKPLPQIDPQIVAACKAQDPSFGLPKGTTGENTQGVTTTPPVAVTNAAPASSSSHPNIVFILTDDLATNLVQYMPHVLEMQKDGVTFANYFVTDSLCCPSRSSIFTGRYPHSTGIFRNQGDDGGYLGFLNRGLEGTTFAISLAASGYRTAMMGKYLNGYLPERHPPAPGWTSWDVAGHAYAEFHYSLNERGKVVSFDNQPADYLTDVLSGLAVQFIKQARGQAFLIEVATFAPHAPYTPAPRDADAFPGLKAPRTAAYDAAPEANAPKWLRKQPALTPADMAHIDEAFRKRAQSVLAVDKMIGELQAAVVAIGQEKNTYFVFSSDNGLHMGEYRLMPGKITAYETDIHVPLVITGPGVPNGVTVNEIVENVDLCPTFTELTGAGSLPHVDGHSLVPLLKGPKSDWRNAALIEHHGPRREPADPDAPGVRSGNPPSYEAIRTPNALYVEYGDGDKEYHDLGADPFEIHNTFSTLSNEQKAAWHAALMKIQNCHDDAGCWATQHVSLDGSGKAPR